MIVLNKKRIIFLISVLMVSFVTILINGDVFGTSNKTNSTIILDGGHGQPDRTAQLVVTGVSEEEINLSIVLKLQELLEQSGYTVILTRSDENGIYDLDEKSMKSKKTSDLKNRVKLANSEEADIFVSIHLNKISRKSILWLANFLSRKK